MSLEEYYTKKSALKAPEELDFIQRRSWFKTQVEKLQFQLSEADLKTVSEQNKEWQNKIDSSIL